MLCSEKAEQTRSMRQPTCIHPQVHSQRLHDNERSFRNREHLFQKSRLCNLMSQTFRQPQNGEAKIIEKWKPFTKIVHEFGNYDNLQVTRTHFPLIQFEALMIYKSQHWKMSHTWLWDLHEGFCNSMSPAVGPPLRPVFSSLIDRSKRQHRDQQ